MTSKMSQGVHFILILFLFFCLGTPISAQEVEERRHLIGSSHLGFIVGIPQQDFADKVDAVGIGVGANVLVGVSDFPLRVGVDFSYAGYENEKLDLELNVGGFFEDFELITRSNILSLHGVVRFEPPVNYFLQPYIEGMIGTKHLYTRTKLVNRSNPEEGTVESNSEGNDWAFSYGGAAGLKVYLYENPGVAVELRCAYLQGGIATYLTIRPDADIINWQEPIEAFESRRSITTLLIPQIGITVELE